MLLPAAAVLSSRCRLRGAGAGGAVYSSNRFSEERSQESSECTARQDAGLECLDCRSMADQNNSWVESYLEALVSGLSPIQLVPVFAAEMAVSGAFDAGTLGQAPVLLQ